MQAKIDFAKVGEHIRVARIEAKKTQKAVAAACGCDPKHISAVENGRTNPSIDLLTKLSEELNVSVDYFLKDAPHACKQYFVEVEFADRINQMTTATKSSLLKIMDQLIVVQNTAAATKE